jgi:beta-phosphoglucomutase
MKKIKACIFDLDGVICDTAKFHFLAWQRLANSLGFDFSEAENEKLKGVSRVESLRLILKWGGVDIRDQEEFDRLAELKNEWYLEFIKTMSPDEIMGGVTDFLTDLRAKNIKIALGSASKNAVVILEGLNIMHFFDEIVDGNSTSRSKPDPEVFLMGAAKFSFLPDECIVFEDAEKGVEAARRGKFWTVGIGEPEILHEAHTVIKGFEGFKIEDITARLALQTL